MHRQAIRNTELKEKGIIKLVNIVAGVISSSLLVYMFLVLALGA
ncbi:MAG: hypothetical protein ACRCTW_09845 [Lactococcus garvieae]